MTKRLTTILLLIAVILVALFPVGNTVRADGPDSDNSREEQIAADSLAFIDIGGVRTRIEVGDRIEVGGATASQMQSSEGGCQFPETHLIGRLTETLNVGHISAVIGADCTITITEITFSSVAPSGASGNINSNEQGAERRKGWAKSELNDFVWIDLTATHVKMYYYDDGNSVYGGHQPKYGCDVFPDGWYRVSCDSTWFPTGLDTVYIRQEGVFDHHFVSPARHWQMARFWAGPGWGDYECGHSGRVWGPVHWECDGSRFAD